MRNSFITEYGKEKYITYIHVNEEYFEVEISVYRRPIGIWQWIACILWDASCGERLDGELLNRKSFDVNSDTMPTAQQIIDKAKVYTNNAIWRYYEKHIRENKLKNLKKDIDKLLTM
jgi:hypothetical protein